MNFKWLGVFLMLPACSGPSATEPVKESETTPPASLETIERLPELMDAFGVSGIAVTVVSGDEILVSEGFGETQDGDDFSSSTSCGLFSATKVLASLTYANLANDGRLDLDAPLGNYIDDAPAAWQDIPFYRLLNHTSGITMAVNKEAFGTIASDPSSQNKDIYEMVSALPLDFEPGAASRYRQSGYAIAEMILKDRLGESFDTLVDQYIAAPAGLRNTKHPAVSEDQGAAILLSAGGYTTTVEDMAQMFLSLNDGTIIAPEAWRSFLETQDYRFGDYSIGSVFAQNGTTVTVGHSGGGARANIRYAPSEKIGVMACTDDRSNKGLARSLARMLVSEVSSGEAPLMPLLVALADYETQTGAAVVDAFAAAKAQTDVYDLSDAEALLNSIGYSFLASERVADAIVVFEANSKAYPESPNTYDSLGEALLASGDRDGALANYRQVLALDPDNANASAMVDKILSETPEQ